MTLNDIKEIIDNIPYLMEYILPGYCFILLLNFMVDRSGTDTKPRFILSVIISYFSAKIINKGVNILSIPKPHTWEFLLIQMVTLLIFGFFIGLLFRSERFNTFVSNTPLKRTFNENFWRDHFIEGVIYRVHIKSGDYYYEGQVTSVEEHSHSPFIELSDFRVIRIEDMYEVENYNHFNIRCGLAKGEKRTMIIGMDSVDYIIAIDTQNIK